jgi:hypothetical protein
VGGKYDAHSDYFDPDLYAKQAHVMAMLDQNGTYGRCMSSVIGLSCSPQTAMNS